MELGNNPSLPGRRELVRAQRHHMSVPIVKSRQCTAVACTVEWPAAGSNSVFVEGVANSVINYLTHHNAGTSAVATAGYIETIYGAATSPAGRMAAGCAHAAAEGWRETAEMRLAFQMARASFHQWPTRLSNAELGQLANWYDRFAMLDRLRLLPPKAPKAQAIAACVLALSNVAAVLISPSLLGGVAVLSAFVVAWLLALGSRIAWTLAVLGSFAGLLGNPHALGVVAAAFLTVVCLFVPSSIRYTWMESAVGRSRRAKPEKHIALTVRARAVVNRFVAWAAGWRQNGDNLIRRYDLLAWRLGGLAVFLLFPLALTNRWEQTSSSSLAEVVARLTWIGWAIVVVAFVVALTLSARQHVQEKWYRGSK